MKHETDVPDPLKGSGVPDLLRGSGRQLRPHDAHASAREDVCAHISAASQPAGNYEPPQVLVIGDVRELTTGSASSGSADANSQYYW